MLLFLQGMHHALCDQQDAPVELLSEVGTRSTDVHTLQISVAEAAALKSDHCLAEHRVHGSFAESSQPSSTPLGKGARPAYACIQACLYWQKCLSGRLNFHLHDSLLMHLVCPTSVMMLLCGLMMSKLQVK